MATTELTRPNSLPDVDDYDDGPTVSGPCTTPSEAYATAIDKARERVGPGLDQRSRWWRYRWLRRVASDPRLVEVAQRHHVNPGTLLRYLHAVADRTNKAGSDPVFTYRATLADQTSLSVATVGRARAAAIDLGYHTAGIQTRWLDLEKNGNDPWCGGASVIFLTMPPSFNLDRSESISDRVAARRRSREEHRLRLQAERDLAHEKELEQLILAAPKELPSRPQLMTDNVRDALRDARHALGPP